MIPELQIGELLCCAVLCSSFAQSQLVEEKGWNSVQTAMIMETGSWHSGHVLVSEWLPWQVAFQCGVFLEHQEFRNILCNFYLSLSSFFSFFFQYVPLPQSVKLIYKSDRVLCVVFLLCSLPGVDIWGKFLLLYPLRMYVLLPLRRRCFCDSEMA